MLYKAQLERTGLITVNLHSADWASYRKNRYADVMPVFMAAWYSGLSGSRQLCPYDAFQAGSIPTHVLQ